MPERLPTQDIVAMSREIVAMSREPLLVLDDRLVVLAASRSFAAAFGTNEVVGSPLAGIAGGQFDIPQLAEQLRHLASGKAATTDFEVRRDSDAGTSTFRLHANVIGHDSHGRALMLTLEDVTELRRIETSCEEALVRANEMLVELHHRVMNSFAMIGAILTMEARQQQDEACRAAFTRMRTRITSIAHLYRKLGRDAPEEVRSDEYLKAIVDDLITSLSDPSCKVEVSLTIDKTLLPARLAVPIGLLVNEIVTNSLKHAFTGRRHGRISVEFAPAEEHHVLRISDDGRGMGPGAPRATGLGQRLSETFARQLRGTIAYTSGPDGTTVVLRFPRSDAR